MRILCTGDEFIAPQLFVEALRAELGDGHSYLTDTSGWPSEPFSGNDEIREFSGDEDRMIDLLDGVQLWLAHLSPVSSRVLAAADRLRFVGVPRGGPVNVNLAAATAAGVTVAHLPGRNAQAVAEYTIAAMITGPRRLAHSCSRMRDGGWTGDLYCYDRTGFELAGADVGLIGLGQIGHRVARLLRAFGARVQAYDPYVDPDVAAETGAVLVGDLTTAISDKQIVSMHARITDETRGMLGADQFAAMRGSTFFVNSARGDLVDEQALIAALRSGHLSGAAVDVFAPFEPPAADNPLRTLPEVFVTSHLAGSSRQVAERAARRIAAEAGRFVRGEPLLNPANPGVVPG